MQIIQETLFFAFNTVTYISIAYVKATSILYAKHIQT